MRPGRKACRVAFAYLLPLTHRETLSGYHPLQVTVQGCISVLVVNNQVLPVPLRIIPRLDNLPLSGRKYRRPGRAAIIKPIMPIQQAKPLV